MEQKITPFTYFVDMWVSFNLMKGYFCNVSSPRSAVKRSKNYAKTTEVRFKENNISLYLSHLFENHKLPLESFQFTFTVCLLLYSQENIERQMTLLFTFSFYQVVTDNLFSFGPFHVQNTITTTPAPNNKKKANNF